MKTRNVLRLLTIMMAAVLSVGFASCGGDDDDTAGGGGNSTPGTGIDGSSVTYGNGMDGTTLNIRLSSAGTLSSYITDENMYKITRLKVSGQLNGTDIWLLRQMAGSDEEGESTNGVLGYLDMLDATIVAGGRPPYSDYYLTEDSTFTYRIFAFCNSLVSISLPQVKEIEEETLYDCKGLTTIVVPKSVKKIARHGFTSDIGNGTLNNLRNFTFMSATPPAIEGSIYTPTTLCPFGYNSGLHDVTLYIPKGSKEAYVGTKSFDEYKNWDYRTQQKYWGYTFIHSWDTAEEGFEHVIEF